MLRLSYSAYAYLRGHDPKKGRAAVRAALDFFQVAGAISWFAVSDDHTQFNFALAFVFLNRRDSTNEYSVVVRGTNPLSLESWFKEDFAVGVQVPWPGGPTGAKISQATATALTVHEGLRDKGQTLFTYLAERLQADAAAGVTSMVRFTGHSLGGLMASVLALRFFETVRPLAHLRIEVCSFAAPTAGNQAFATYTEETFRDIGGHTFGVVRFIRCRDDVVVKVWNPRDMLGILRLYTAQGMPINLFLILVLGLVRWTVRHKGYTQPFADSDFGQTFRVPPLDVFAFDSFDAEDFLDGTLQGQFHRAKAIARRHTSQRVFRNTVAWVVQAVVMHVVPYACHLLDEREQRYVAQTILRTILTHDTLFVERRATPRTP